MKMSSDFVAPIHPFQPEPKVADRATIRKFVKDLEEIGEKVKEARDDLKEVVLSNEEVQRIDEEIKTLRANRKKVIEESTVIQSYVDELNDVLEEQKQILADAESDGVPKKEINLAIKALKTDIDISVATQVYSEIADLV